MTFMMQSCRMANLGPILRTEPVEKAMPSFRAAWEQLSEEDRRGMRLDETRRLDLITTVLKSSKHDQKPRTLRLNKNIHDALRLRLESEAANPPTPMRSSVVVPRIVFTHPGATIRGVVYKVHSRSQGDSNVIFRHPAYPFEQPGRIAVIFTANLLERYATAPEIFIAVERLLPLNGEDIQKDPYRSYGDTGGSLYYDAFDEQVLVIRPEDVVCHYAKTSMKGVPFVRTAQRPEGGVDVIPMAFQRECVHVLRLGKVWLSPSV